eukprot:jgi/Hompol1/4046/HPOL_003449-RA
MFQRTTLSLSSALRVPCATWTLSASAWRRFATQTQGEAATATATAPAFVAPAAPVVVRRVGYVRGGIFGFLLGLSSAGAAAYVYLLDEYQQSSNSLLSGVDNLQKSTEKLKTYTAKIDLLERDLKSIPKIYTTQREYEELRNELLKAIDAVHIEHLELKTQVWEKSHS